LRDVVTVTPAISLTYKKKDRLAAAFPHAVWE